VEAQDLKDPPGFASFRWVLDDENNPQRWETEELLDAAEAVLELTRHPGWGHVQRLLEERERSLMDLLVIGPQPLEQAEYARFTGIAAGVKDARYVADAVLHAARLREQEEREAAEAAEAEGQDG
jgi:hypothetical protein